jgi:hypothetical protein
MQVGSSSLLPQLQTLGSAALKKYESGGDFSFTVDDSDSADGSADAGASGGGDKLSGTFQTASLVAVGTMTADGKLQPYSAAQVQGEEDMVANMGQIAFADSLQNFLTLAQAGSSSGQLAASSYSDQQSFIGDNGLVSATYSTSFSLSPGGSQPYSTPGSTTSITA